MTGRSLDALLAAAGIDPGDGVQAARADRLASVPFDPSLPLIVLAAEPATDADPATPVVLPGRHARRTPLELLRALYPAAHELRPLPSGVPVPLDALSEGDLASGDWLIPAL